VVGLKDVPFWNVVVVDDDPDVFKITQLVLRRYTVLGKPLKLLQCQSGREARALLVEKRSFAVLITDVVMEDDDAGLTLVQWVRQQPHLCNTRIVIRTGQPGLAPEAAVLDGLDINDYWTKQDLSSRRIKTLITGLIRSYRDLEQRAESQQRVRRELLRSEEQLKDVVRSQSLFQAVSDSVSAGTLLIQGGDLIHVNARAEEILRPFSGSKIDRVSHLPPPLNSSQPPPSGEISKTVGRITNWVSFQTRVVNQDEIQGFLVTLTDTTAWKRSESQRLKADRDLLRTVHLEQVSLLASGVAHDLNNLITIIVGTSEYLHELSQEPEMAAGLTDIQEACKAATALAQQMMLYGSGGEAVRRLQDIRILVERSVDLWTGEAKRNGVRLEFIGDEDEPLMVEVADSQIQQTIGNLVSNALRAMPDGGTIQVTLTHDYLQAADLQEAAFNSDVEPGRYVLLAFQDEGTGMHPEDMALIFAPFYTTNKTGRGIGLATIRGIATRLGAAIFVYSKRGEGTTFKIAIPMAVAGVPKAAPRQLEAPKGRRRILVLDDVALVRRQICRTLVRGGHEVVEAATLAEAKLAMTEHFDGAVVDFMLEHTTGDVALIELRLLQPDLPAVLCSGYISPESMKNTRKFSEVIHKPFKRSDLLEAVERCISKTPDHEYL